MPGYTCICDKGYQIDETGTKCIGESFQKFIREKRKFGKITLSDIDECAADLHNCPSPAECRNTDGSFECHCPEGFAMENEICIDINECK